MRVLVLLTVLPVAAFADAQTVEHELRMLAMPERPGRGFHAAAFAQLVAGTAVGDDERASEATAAVGADVRYSGSRCDYLRAGGQARIGADVRPTYEQWATACAPIFVMELGHHLEWDVRPALLAPLAMRPGTNRRESVRFRWQPLRARLGPLLSAIVAGEARKQGVKLTDPIDPDDPEIPSGDGIVFDVGIRLELLWSPGRPLVAREVAEVLFLGYEREHRAPWGDQRNFTVDILRTGGVFVDDRFGARVENKATAIRANILELENLRLGPVYASAGIGIASGSAGEYVDLETYEREISITRARALLAVETGGSSIHGHVRATQDLDVPADGYVAYDQRIRSGVGWVGRGLRVDLHGAIAKTTVHRPGAMPAAQVTGGGALAVAYALTPHLDATLQVDLARSFYAANVTQLDFIPRWGAYAFAGVQARVGR